MVIADPVAALRECLRTAVGPSAARLAVDHSLAPDVHWRPHVYDADEHRAWHLLSALPESDGWMRRMSAASGSVAGLRFGICGPMEVLQTERAIAAADQLKAALLPVKSAADHYEPLSVAASAADFVYERQLRLTPPFARALLDTALNRARACPDTYEKGALLELVLALMLSQVGGFEVTDRGISSKNQQIDVNAVNRNVAGPLGRGQFVLGEAKNWSKPVEPEDYVAFASKLRTRRGMAKLGFLVTTNRFTAGVQTAFIRESHFDDLIVLLNRETLPAVWRDHESITAGVEDAIKKAVYDHATD